jgi:histidinol dehydrogenase
MSRPLLRRIGPGEVSSVRRAAVDDGTLAGAAGIVRDVKMHGEAAVRAHAERLGDLTPGAPMVRSKEELAEAARGLPGEQRALLERTAERIGRFAAAQRGALREIEVDIPGGRAGHTISPVERAGCYAPGGRFPLPSSVLMTVVTARAAGVGEVWVASPRPTMATLAAAAIAGADGLLAVGGAQAIAAMAYGVGVPPCDVIVGPGNRWVTAAKRIVSGDVRIDMLAGPSELVVFADGSVDAGLVAADLLAQAEHDGDAVPILVTTDVRLAAAVDEELERQLALLPTAATARRALANGYAVVVGSAREGADVCDRIAPEHLELMGPEAEATREDLRHYGGLFIGARAAEVFGDYGAGPNHVLPTGGTARFTGGLSVLDFLRVRTWMQVDRAEEASEMVRDSAALARMEGLEGHARAAERRSAKL